MRPRTRGLPGSPDMQRTVHPALVTAVLRALRRDPVPCRATEEAERLLAAREPIAERLHARLLATLHSRGPAAMSAAAGHLLDRPRDPLIDALVSSASLADAVSRSRLAERWFHVGHITDTAWDRRGLTVRHEPYLGGRPQLPETLFVCAVYGVVAAAVTGRTARVRLLADDGALLPLEAAWRQPGPEVRGWRLEWGAGGLPGMPENGRAGSDLVDTVRGWVALDPARSWRVADVAARLRMAPRSLQRSLAQAGTTFQGELVAVRLDVAGQLMRRTRLPIAEVAAAAGFTDQAHLTRWFRERLGCTPARFRRRREEEGARDGTGHAAPARAVPLRKPGAPPGAAHRSRSSRRRRPA